MEIRVKDQGPFIKSGTENLPWKSQRIEAPPFPFYGGLSICNWYVRRLCKTPPICCRSHGSVREVGGYAYSSVDLYSSIALDS